ncbi:MAG: hypothetical protein IPP72_14730 [Chitinophagaceae bacterium]|nr:hypothetical protein [Chitinophagaceae bacterium]
MIRAYIFIAAISILQLGLPETALQQTALQKPVEDTLPAVSSCSSAKAGTARASILAKDNLFIIELNSISSAFKTDLKEHVVAFGKDSSGKMLVSPVSQGTGIGGTVPVIQRAFADLHNHTNSAAPGAGDLYGLIDINKNDTQYDTRFVLTATGIVYALLITDPAAAVLFNTLYPRQPPAFAGAPPAFPEQLVDEFRELKYQYDCTDEMAMAFILDKYHAGVALLKLDGNSDFKILITKTSVNNEVVSYTAVVCPG